MKARLRMHARKDIHIRRVFVLSCSLLRECGFAHSVKLLVRKRFEECGLTQFAGECARRAI
jgi:hypothetical protein